MIEIEKTGFKAICSMYGVPHGKQTILDNNFPGQFCLHFYNSKTSGTKVTNYIFPKNKNVRLFFDEHFRIDEL